MPGKPPSRRSTSAEVAAFLGQVGRLPATGQAATGRLIVAMDATASRAPLWSEAVGIQAEMFAEAAKVGGLEVQLVYYRGIADFGASAWTSDAERMIALMRRVTVESGYTQIERTLRHAAAETRAGKVNALVFVGDAVEEPADLIVGAAGALALRGVPVFIFHEGGGEPAGAIFRDVARVTKGAYSSFDAASPQQLRDLLKAVAIFAAGGRKALEDFGRRAGGLALQLTHRFGDPLGGQ